MGIAEFLALPLAGFFAGVLSAVVGGAGLIVIPGMLWAGLTPSMAVSSTITALMPGNLSASYAERSQWPPLTKELLVIFGISLASSLVGAALLMITPAHVLAALIPVFLGTATLLFAYSGSVSERLKAKRKSDVQVGLRPSALPLLIPAAIYQGYFGVGASVIFLAALSVVLEGNYRSANALKNF